MASSGSFGDEESLTGWSSINEKDDSDEMPEERSQEPQLEWRGDPAQTHSDWTIQVISQESDGGSLWETNDGDDGGGTENPAENPWASWYWCTGSDKCKRVREEVKSRKEAMEQEKETSEFYHVHKSVLASGDRRSESLGILFCYAKEDTSAKVELPSLGAKLDRESSTIRLELPTMAAQVFPDLLDYMYKPENDLVVSTLTATALHFLGQHLGIPKLRWEAKQFWMNDLCLEKSGIYYEHACILDDENILDAIKEILADQVLKIKPEYKIVRVSDCQLWLDVLELLHARGGDDRNKKIRFLSEIIAEFADKNIYCIGEKGFSQITAADKLPVVSYRAAVALMDTNEVLGAKANTDLQDRCTTALSQQWESVHIKFDDDQWRRLGRTRKGFQRELYKKTLKQCSEEKQAMELRLISVIEDCKKVNTAAANELNKLREELEATKAKLDEANAELKSFQPVVEKRTIRQRGRFWFGKKSVQPYCDVDGRQKVYYKASVC